MFSDEITKAIANEYLKNISEDTSKSNLEIGIRDARRGIKKGLLGPGKLAKRIGGVIKSSLQKLKSKPIDETTLLQPDLNPQQQKRMGQLASILAARDAAYKYHPTQTTKWKALEALKAMRAKRSNISLQTGAADPRNPQQTSRGVRGNMFDRSLSPEDAIRNDKNRKLMAGVRRSSGGNEHVLRWALSNPGSQTGT